MKDFIIYTQFRNLMKTIWRWSCRTTIIFMYPINRGVHNRYSSSSWSTTVSTVQRIGKHWTTPAGVRVMVQSLEYSGQAYSQGHSRKVECPWPSSPGTFWHPLPTHSVNTSWGILQLWHRMTLQILPLAMIEQPKMILESHAQKVETEVDKHHSLNYFRLGKTLSPKITPSHPPCNFSPELFLSTSLHENTNCLKRLSWPPSSDSHPWRCASQTSWTSADPTKFNPPKHTALFHQSRTLLCPAFWNKVCTLVNLPHHVK